MVLAEPMVKSRIEIPWEENGHGVEGLEKGLCNLFLLRNRDIVTKATNKDELHGRYGLSELKQEGIMVPFEGPVTFGGFA